MISKGLNQMACGIHVKIIRLMPIGLNAWLWTGFFLDDDVAYLQHWDSQGNHISGNPHLGLVNK